MISMTLGMVLSNRARIGCSGAGLDRADDQTFNRQTGLDAQLAARDMRFQPRLKKQAPDVLGAVVVAPMRARSSRRRSGPVPTPLRQ